MSLRVALDDLLPVKQAARSLPASIGRLESGTSSLLVLTRRSRPVAVMVSVARYEELLAAAERCRCPQGWGEVRDPSCPRHRSAAHTVSGAEVAETVQQPRRLGAFLYSDRDRRMP